MARCTMRRTKLRSMLGGPMDIEWHVLRYSGLDPAGFRASGLLLGPAI